MTTDAEYELMEARADREMDRMDAEVGRLRAELHNATADRAALDVAVRGLRDLETRFAENRETAADRADEHVAQAWDIARGTVSGLLDRVGATR